MNQQVKICPKCKAQNEITNGPCKQCGESLAGVYPTFNRPQNSESAPIGGMPGGPIGAYSPSPRPASNNGSAVFGWIVALLIIGGAAFGGWWFFMKPLAPDQVVTKFLEAAIQQDFDKIRPYITNSDIDSMGGEEAAKTSFANGAKDVATSKDKLPKIGEVTYENENTAVVAIIDDTGSDPTSQELIKLGFKPSIVTVREDGKWKVSMQQTQQKFAQEMMRIFTEQSQKNGANFGAPGR